MAKNRKQRSKKVGLAPGSIGPIGDAPREDARVTFTEYDQQTAVTRPFSGVALPPLPPPPGVVRWIASEGVGDHMLLESLGRLYGIHPLTLEDIATADQRPKLEDFGDYLFLTFKAVYMEADEIAIEQVALLLLPGCVVSFVERPGALFAHVADRIANARGQIRQRDAGYLAYALLDAVVDRSFEVIERMEDHLESLQEEAARRPTSKLLREIQRVRREAIHVRRAIRPMREVIASMAREGRLVGSDNKVFLRDALDHVVHAVEALDAARESADQLMDVYLSGASNRMSEAVTRLTSIATIFMPLTFIAGVYGMNFHDMPELSWRYGYPMALGLMLLSAVAMIFFLRRQARK
ncbi:MAG: magnesium/cobalt transporter CorA [Nitrospinae bacterium]|nr:magnesium/cobalt transporter CorA [Nitrospinota bacterium]